MTETIELIVDIPAVDCSSEALKAWLSVKMTEARIPQTI
jgi:hypothetical protein